jgi:large subunit ribosomal protein L25
MISDITIEATVRTRTGSADSRRLRLQGLIPATVYGDKKDPLSVVVNAKQIATILRSGSGHNTIFKLKAADQGMDTVMIKEWQLDPVKGKLIHADFYRISLTEKQRVSVPLELVGEPQGVKLGGGILEHVLRELEIECLPAEIPEHITIDVSGMDVGDHFMVKELKVSDNMRVITTGDHIIASVLAPRVTEETASVEIAEPEVIKKGKVEEK